LNVFERFRTFLNVFFLPGLPKLSGLTHQAPFLPQKPTSPSKKTLKNPDFPSIFEFLFVIFLFNIVIPAKAGIYSLRSPR